MPYNPPPQDHFNPNHNFSQSKVDHDYELAMGQPRPQGFIRRWWNGSSTAGSTDNATAAAVMNANDNSNSIFTQEDIISSNNRGISKASAVDMASGIDTRDAKKSSFWSWLGARTDNDDSEFVSRDGHTDVNDIRSIHPNANVDDADVGTGLVDLSRKISGKFDAAVDSVKGSATDLGQELKSWGGEVKDAIAPTARQLSNTITSDIESAGGLLKKHDFRSGAARMGGDEEFLATNVTNAYISSVRNGGRCSAQLGDYERCMGFTGGDSARCGAAWDAFLSCKEGAIHNVV